jgi:hypothetical protein
VLNLISIIIHIYCSIRKRQNNTSVALSSAAISLPLALVIFSIEEASGGHLVYIFLHTALSIAILVISIRFRKYSP